MDPGVNVKMRRLSAVLAGVALIVFGTAVHGIQTPATPVPSSPESIAAGAKVYAVWCRSCHGLRGRGDGVTAPPGTKPANLVDADWKHGGTDAEIFKTIKEGIAPFDAMKPQAANLSDADIWNVLNYLRSLAAVKK
jgi:mono/diheme cytochrome c family protein